MNRTQQTQKTGQDFYNFLIKIGGHLSAKEKNCALKSVLRRGIIQPAQVSLLPQTKGVNCMKFTFTCKKVDLNDSVKEYAEKKISKLDRYFKNEAEANITFSVEKNNRCVVEVTIRGGNTLFRAQEENKEGNMRAAIDTAQEYIDRQIRKNKTRLEKRLRQGAFDPSVLAAEPEVSEEREFQIVREKHFSIKPMSAEEAILQMNLLDHSFFLFRRENDNALCIVYARKNGGYGLIEADEAIEE